MAGSWYPWLLSTITKMEGEEGRRELAENPLLAQMIFVKMDDLMDKLKILNYENRFCRELKFRPIPRHYFALTTNSGEQFHVFTNLAVWLLNVCGHRIEQPQEYDDPNATIATIIEETKRMKIPLNFPPMKLKTGSGEQVCHVLNCLADSALSATKFKWKRPQHLSEEGQDEVIEEGGRELSLSHLEGEEEVHEDIESEDEGNVFLDLTNIDNTNTTSESKVLVDALESKVDPEQWKMEVESVLPSLKVRFRQDNRDWRVHYEQMHQYHDGIKTVLSETKGHLDKLHQEIAKTLEKMSSREKYINHQLEHQILAFRSVQDNLAQVRERYKEGSYSVNELARELAQVTSELEEIKAEMDERGSSMTDAGPVVRIKQALTKLRNECNDMEVQIGLAEHSLLESKFKTKGVIKLQMTEGVRPSRSSNMF